MYPSRITNFCKNEDCPTSQELVDFQNGDMERERGVDIRIHINVCEFCAAEVEFYSRYPLSSEEPIDEPAAIPAPLFELAEALLRNRNADVTSFNMMFGERF